MENKSERSHDFAQTLRKAFLEASIFQDTPQTEDPWSNYRSDVVHGTTAHYSSVEESREDYETQREYEIAERRQRMREVLDDEIKSYPSPR